MFCRYCGVDLPNDSLFCNKCGKPQQPENSTPATNIGVLVAPSRPGSPMSGVRSPLETCPWHQELHRSLVQRASLLPPMQDHLLRFRHVCYRSHYMHQMSLDHVRHCMHQTPRSRFLSLILLMNRIVRQHHTHILNYVKSRITLITHMSCRNI